MTSWVQYVGKRNGLVIVIKSSEIGGNGRKPRISYWCERSGKYRGKPKENEKSKKGRLTGTKKCACPFLLQGVSQPEEDHWMLQVISGVHNHPAAEYLEGHSYVGRLSSEETDILVTLSKSLVRPKEILYTLKQRDETNASTMKTIYNARQRHRVQEQAGKSQMQMLLGNLSSHNYIEWHRVNEKNDVVKDLFYAHPTSVELLRTFPHVLIMDCTYKTNRYRLPLLEIVGFTSTNMTYTIACAYMEVEREDYYVWALERLRGLMVDCPMPRVIVTDRELALMNGIDKVFPTSRHFLCRWHINRNILAKCKNYFDNDDKWKLFISNWNMLEFASTEEKYIEEFDKLHREFNEYQFA